MKSYAGDKVYQNIVDKLGKEELLVEEDYINLAFLPLMKSKNSEEEQTLKAAEIIKNEEAIPEHIKDFLIAALIVISDKFMSEANKKRLQEVLKMTQIEQWIKEKNMEEVAIALIKEDVPVETISRSTGLNEKRILELKEKKLN